MEDFVLSIDVGGTKTLVALVDQSGNILAEWKQPTRSGVEDEVFEVARFARACFEKFISGQPHSKRLLGVAAGFPEYVSKSGTLTSHEVLKWKIQPIEALSQMFASQELSQQSIVVESDVRLGAIGESSIGASSSSSSSFYISLGTGLSSAFVLDSSIWKGFRGEAIAFGESSLPISGFKNLESYCSGAAVEARYARESGQSLRGAEISEKAMRDDPVAISVLETAGVALGDALANVSQILDPEILVLGGGLGSVKNHLTVSAFEQYRLVTSYRPDPPKLVQAALGHRSALIGGAAIAWTAVGRPFRDLAHG
jgi:glucokinase